MPESRIGQYVRRARRGGAFHRVESEIAGAMITRCGRRMEPTAQRGAGLEFEQTDGSGEDVRPECLVCRLGVGR